MLLLRVGRARMASVTSVALPGAGCHEASERRLPLKSEGVPNLQHRQASPKDENMAARVLQGR